MENKSVTRLDVLKKAKEIFLSDENIKGLGEAMILATKELNASPKTILYHHICFPEFTFINAKDFGADGDPVGYWWKDGSLGQIDFIDWLIGKYEDDETTIDSIEIKD
jgi:hypothetical protein